MLVINRKTNESVMIGDDIEIIVSEVDNDRVKLCINAPRDVVIMRKELLEVKKINVQASETLDDNKDSKREKMKALAEGLNKLGEAKNNGYW